MSKKAKAAHERDGEKLAAAFKALSNPTRLRIFEAIRRGATGAKMCSAAARPADAPPGAVCVCEIIEAVSDVTPPTISHHLKELRNAGLVEAAKCGQWQYYSARADALEALGNYFKSSCD